MRKLQIAIWAAALVATGSLQAQQRGTLAFGGAVLNQDGVLAGEMAQMSQPQALGTARSMALGGAFTSLGADLASMSINPAGLGMCRRFGMGADDRRHLRAAARTGRHLSQ